MTDAQTKPPKLRKPRTLSAAVYKRGATLEKHVQDTVTQFLELDGWRAIRTEHAIERNERGGFKRRVGEVGMPDYLYLRYLNKSDPGVQVRFAKPGRIYDPLAEALWIEFKRPGEQPRTGQVEWIEAEHRRGALVMVVDDVDQFMSWYGSSGLKRR